jgi:hypothetical protein
MVAQAATARTSSSIAIVTPCGRVSMRHVTPCEVFRPARTRYSTSPAALTIASASSASPGSTFAGTVYVNATYRAGVGETAASANQASALTIAAGNGITVTLPSIVAGAFGVNLYLNVVSQSAGPFAVGAIYALGTYTRDDTTVTINLSQVNTGNTVAALPTDNSSANGYDGLLTVGLNSALSGYANSSGGSIGTNGDAVFQSAFNQMYLNNRANRSKSGWTPWSA